MPTFKEYGVEVDVDLDITIDEFVDGCDSRELGELIERLIDGGHISSASLIETGTVSLLEGEFISKISDLSSKFYSMSNEDIEKIEELHKKYC